ncbi:GNAT family N-acetyltransferase [Bradyrhizobium elkanii]|uniref:GNAT family N-acetyltransferase n=1 Tax=Bradyrhizobium elkanii TaxID=29448 RepID=UPI003BAA8375
MSIRRLTPADTDAAAGVHRAAFDETLPWLAGPHTPDEDRWFYRERMFATCTLWGGALLEIARQDAGRLQLWTFQRNARARRFYETRGFVADEETDVSGNEEREPGVHYRWTRGPADE